MRPRLAALLLVALAAAARLCDLHADPPLVFDAAHLTDEGYYTKNARDLILTGQLVRSDDNHNHLWLAPLTVLWNYLWMELSIPTLLGSRLASAMAGLFLALLAAWLANRLGGRVAGLVTLGLVAVEPALTALSRQALAEAPLALASTAYVAALAVEIERSGPPRWSLALFLTALLFKASALSLIPSTLVIVLLFRLSRRDPAAAIREAVRRGLAMGAIVLAWYVFYIRQVAPARFMFEYEMGTHVSGEGWLEGIRRTIQTLHFVLPFRASPLLLGVAAPVAALGLLGRLRGIRVSRLQLLAIGWLTGEGLFFSAMPYQPARYFLVLVVPAILLVASTVPDPRAPHGPLLARGVALHLAILAVSVTAQVAAYRSAGLPRPASLLLALGGAAWLTVTLRRGWWRTRVATLAVASVLVLTSWWQDRTHTVRDIADELARLVGPDDVVSGYFASTFVTRSQARPVVVHGPWNPDRCALERLGVTYLLVRWDEWRWLTDRDPDLPRRLRYIDTFRPLGGVRGTLRLYRIEESDPLCVESAQAAPTP